MTKNLVLMFSHEIAAQARAVADIEIDAGQRRLPVLNAQYVGGIEDNCPPRPNAKADRRRAYRVN